jgi:hypothetical protein
MVMKVFVSEKPCLGLVAGLIRTQTSRWPQATVEAGVCIRNSLESLFLKEGMNGRFARATRRGVQRDEAPLRYYLPLKIGGQGVASKLVLL